MAKWIIARWIMAKWITVEWIMTCTGVALTAHMGVALMMATTTAMERVIT